MKPLTSLSKAKCINRISYSSKNIESSLSSLRILIHISARSSSTDYKPGGYLSVKYKPSALESLGSINRRTKLRILFLQNK